MTSTAGTLEAASAGCAETASASGLVGTLSVMASAPGGAEPDPEPEALPALKDSNVSKNNGKSRRMNGAIVMSAVSPVATISLFTSASRCSEALVLAGWLSNVAPLYLQQKLDMCCHGSVQAMMQRLKKEIENMTWREGLKQKQPTT
jgi:hypothetical protein